MSIDRFPTIEGLANDLRSGKTTATELAEYTFERIDALDTRLNAFVCQTRDRAMKEAKAADLRLKNDPNTSVLCGIPYAVKDIFDVAGEATGAGCPLLSDNRATRDSNAVSRLTDAGMVLVGKTRTSPFACEITGLNHSEPPTCNPWKQEPHVAGGSSKGSAVAVAAGMVPMALGSDTGGSVRTPAALCGITGHKTTLGEIGRGGVFPLAESLDTVGALTRSVDDAAVVFDALRGEDPRDPTVLGRRTRKRPSLSPEECRIVVAEGALFDGVDAEVEASVRALAQACRELGISVESREIPLFSEVIEVSERPDLIDGEAWRNTGQFLKAWGDDRDRLTNWILDGRKVDDDRLAVCRKERERLQAEFTSFTEGIDAFLVPTVCMTTRPIAMVDGAYGAHVGRYVRNTNVGNFLNLCALSLPCGLDSDERPIGAMFYAAPFADDRLLALGSLLQSGGLLHDLTPDSVRQ